MDSAESEFSPLPQLSRAVESWLRRETSLEQVQSELAIFENAIQTLENNFRQEYPYRAYLPQFAELGSELATSFVLIGVQLQELEELLQGDASEIREQLSYLRVSVGKMQGCVTAIQDLVDSEEKFSDSPYVHELIRVAYAVLEEKLPVEALAHRLEGYQMVVSRSLHEFENSAVNLSPKDHSLVSESTELMENGLELVSQFVGDPGDEIALEEGLASLEEAAHLLLSVRQDLQSRDESKREQRCPRCGRINLATHKICAQCGSKLITSIDETRPSFDFTLNPDGQLHSYKSPPNLLDRIIEGCQNRLQLGEVDPGLEQSISELQRKLHRLKYPVSRMSRMGTSVPLEFQEELAEGALAFLELLEDSQEQLNTLRQALKLEDQVVLREALEVFTEIAQELFQAQPEWEALSQKVLSGSVD